VNMVVRFFFLSQIFGNRCTVRIYITFFELCYSASYVPVVFAGTFLSYPLLLKIIK
jgi:hypothetical protein